MSGKSALVLVSCVPLLATVVILCVANSLSRSAAEKDREYTASLHAAEGLAPYAEELAGYFAAGAALRDCLTNSPLPALPLGVPPPERQTLRADKAVDGWISVRERFSWSEIKSGQAFAVLASFTAPEVKTWRIASLDLSALPDGENASFSVVLENAEPAQE